MNAVNISAHRLSNTHAVNAVNLSANRSYNPPCSEHCEFGYRVAGTLCILVNALNTLNAVNLSATR